MGSREAGAMKPMIFGLALAIALRAAEEKTTEHKTFSGVRELVIDNITGFIEVTASTGGSVEMDIEKTLSGSSEDRLSLARKEISLAINAGRRACAGCWSTGLSDATAPIIR